MTNRIGIFGGTFDPIHNGHLRLAEAAVLECGLERILFLPTAYPPHKEPEHLTLFQHRFEMLRLALEGREHFECSRIEESLPPPSYTIDTVHFLKKSLDPGTDMYFLIGIDAFLEICTWKDYNELLKSIFFVVSERDGVLDEQKNSLAQALGYRQESHHWKSIAGDKNEIRFLHQSPLVVSSSGIRERMKCGKTIAGLVPPQVHEYILKHGLYRSDCR